ncbi:unnamed protein product, partial [Closterium sp. NIES-54]
GQFTILFQRIQLYFFSSISLIKWEIKWDVLICLYHPTPPPPLRLPHFPIPLQAITSPAQGVNAITVAAYKRHVLVSLILNAQVGTVWCSAVQCGVVWCCVLWCNVMPSPFPHKNAITVAAYKRHVLVSLILHAQVGGVVRSGVFTPGIVQRGLKACCQDYHDLANIYMSRDAAELKKFVDSHEQAFKANSSPHTASVTPILSSYTHLLSPSLSSPLLPPSILSLLFLHFPGQQPRLGPSGGRLGPQAQHSASHSHLPHSLALRPC